MQSSTLNPTYTDFSGINTMRAQARVDPQSSLKQVAKQFEGIFIQMMLKSMRDASMGDDIFDSDQSRLYRDMFDKQIALDMANGKGIGIAEAMVRQLEKNVPSKTPARAHSQISSGYFEHSNRTGNANGKILPQAQSNEVYANSQIRGIEKYGDSHSSEYNEDTTKFNSPEEFTNYILPFAEDAAKELGVSPLVLVSQAALETGWGKAVIRHRDGESSHNLFNIKADSRWDGERVSKSTLEYHNGIAKYENASFRSYDSFADSFDDYVDFLRTNHRYSTALQHSGDDEIFIKDLHQAGYATDPNYADKIISILNRDTIQQADYQYEQEVDLDISLHEDRGVMHGV